MRSLSLPLVLLLLLLVPACRGPSPTATTRTRATATDYPWPECPAIAAWLDQHLADPTGWQVITWHMRTPQPQYQRTDIIVRYRARNRFGGWSVYEHAFKVHDGGRVEESSSAVEY